MPVLQMLTVQYQFGGRILEQRMLPKPSFVAILQALGQKIVPSVLSLAHELKNMVDILYPDKKIW